MGVLLAGGFEKTKEGSVYRAEASYFVLPSAGGGDADPVSVAGIEFLKNARAGAVSLFYGGHYVITIGGHDLNGARNDVEIFDLEREVRFYRGIWALKTARAYHACAMPFEFKKNNGEVGRRPVVCAGGVAIGGPTAANHEILDTVEIWYFRNFVRNTREHYWIQLATKLERYVYLVLLNTYDAVEKNLLRPRMAFVLVHAAGSSLLAIGGTDGTKAVLPSEEIVNDEAATKTIISPVDGKSLRKAYVAFVPNVKEGGNRTNPETANRLLPDNQKLLAGNQKR